MPVADYVVIDVAGTIAAGGDAHHIPDRVDDRTAASLPSHGAAVAALAVVHRGPGGTLLTGGAGGRVGQIELISQARLLH
jgi:NADPH:quinone reductase-like Zn-dependent oxidoreductase